MSDKKYVIKSISFTDDDGTLKLLNDLKTRAKIDGLSFSKLVENALKEFLQRHPVPNPQLLMAYYVKPEEPQPLRVLCYQCQGALSDGRIFCLKKGGIWIDSIQCYSCKNNRLRKRK